MMFMYKPMRMCMYLHVSLN